MKRYAVFVDAGYLYAQGSVALAGRRLSRETIELNLSATIDKLRNSSGSRTDNAPLLRIYWYDGLLRGELSTDQQRLAGTDNIKLRLGIVNRTGQQKGVDSLIVTDLVELARNQAITDAVLLSGDEDLRIGVQIAQSFGVRVHLIGIEPSRGSQSIPLMQEADTTTEWSKADISDVMTLKPGVVDAFGAPDNAASPDGVGDAADVLEKTVDAFFTSLSQGEIETIKSLEGLAHIPKEIDSRLLAMCGNSMGRRLDIAETVNMRNILREKALAAS